MEQEEAEEEADALTPVSGDPLFSVELEDSEKMNERSDEVSVTSRGSGCVSTGDGGQKLAFERINVLLSQAVAK